MTHENESSNRHIAFERHRAFDIVHSHHFGCIDVIIPSRLILNDVIISYY